ncbi:hypothetical protein WMO40_20580 [Bacillaceae bacterium CLA-AA-H227]|uniref:Uncharacterized protein n=1 Tax=Robertmurraya yapensis (ex Hitch et al 2024) TaxID=3133160 RepID=A0ACC6SJ61_9BACI
MINQVLDFNLTNSLEVKLEHPISEIGDISMFVIKIPHNQTFIFSIPFHRWSYQIVDKEKIDLIKAPSGFNRPPFKGLLIAAMQQTIALFDETNT